MQLSDKFLEQWDHIISSVDKTEVPLECINKIVIRLQGGRQKTINLAKLKRDGFDLEDYLDSIEKKFLLKALEKSGGVKKRAADLLKMTFRSFRYKLSKYGMSDDE